MFQKGARVTADCVMCYAASLSVSGICTYVLTEGSMMLLHFMQFFKLLAVCQWLAVMHITCEQHLINRLNVVRFD